MQGFEGLLRIWGEPGATQQYYPILYSAFWLEHRAWGGSVLGYHLLNVCLHTGCAYLLTRILRFLNVRGAWLAGFIFALHPVCTEAVAWISEQKSTLSGVFCFGAALAWLHFDRSRSRILYALGLFLFILALLSKTVTATLPAALLLILWWRRGKIEWKRDALPLVPWLFTGAAAGLTTAWVEKHFVGASGADFALTFFERTLLAGRVIWFYAAKVLWPANLTFIYPRWVIDPGVWWQWLFTPAFLALIAALVFVARRNRAPLAAALLFAGTLFPALGFLDVYPFRYSWVADHFQYLACIGIIVPVAWLLSGIERPVGTVASAILVAALGASTWRQAHMYTDPTTLYLTTLERNPACWMAHNNLAIQLAKSPSRREEAIGHIRAAIELKNNYYEAWNNLGSVVSGIPGRQAEAMEDFRIALRMKPDYPEALFNLGNEYYKMPNRLADAVTEYRAALKAKSNFPAAHANLGAILVMDPAHRQEGLDELQTAVKLDPEFIPARMNLAITLASFKEHQMEAQLEYAEIVRRAPRLAAARLEWGRLLLRNPDSLSEAILQLRAAVAVAPQVAEMHVGLAVALFRVPGKSDEAVRQLEIALKLKPDLAVAQQMLKVANAQIH